MVIASYYLLKIPNIPLLQNNITEIRTDAVKLLTMFKRPVPRAAATVGAWLNIFQVLNKAFQLCSVYQKKMLYLNLTVPILLLFFFLSKNDHNNVIDVHFQFLIVMSICTNCALLAWLYDQEGKWKIEPGLAAILVMEHVLLLIKFGFSRFVPEVSLSLSVFFFVMIAVSF